MRIVVLTGGIGGARFLLGVRAYAREVGAEVTAVVGTGDGCPTATPADDEDVATTKATVEVP